MKKLSVEEIKKVANELVMSELEAKEVTELFADILEKEQGGKKGWKIHLQLNCVDEYVREWEDHWHREKSWDEFYAYEKENYFDDYAYGVFDTVDTFKEYVKLFGYAYELERSGMIAAVC